MDVMMNNMESTIAERTAELREEKSKTEELLHGKKKKRTPHLLSKLGALAWSASSNSAQLLQIHFL